MRYKLFKSGSELRLQRNGKILVCPWNQAEPACADWCPFFEVRESNGDIRLTLCCTPTSKIIAIDGGLPRGSKV